MDVMRLLYERHAKQGVGYTEADYQAAIEELTGRSYASFFTDFYYGTKDVDPLLTELLAYVGLSIRNIRSRLYFENRFGFKVKYIREKSAEITDIAPDSIADKAGLKAGDEITAINDIRLLGNLKEWCKYFMEETVILTVNSGGDTTKIALTPTDEFYYRTRWPEKDRTATDTQKANYLAWTGREF
jgi:predicted metalloprotease with PDZ domain